MTALRTAGITVCFLVCVAACAAEPVQIPCAVQIATTASDGKHTVPEIIAACRNQGIKAVILADRDLMQWEYGVWPLRNVFKKTVRHKSLFTYGIRRYLAELENLQKQNPDLIVIAGVESAPFYYWKGSVFNDDLTLVDWHKHVLAVGLKDAGDYAMLPVIGNKKALALPFIARNLYLFWPLLLIGAGAVWCKRRRMRAGLIAVAIGAVFLVNNFPFRYYRFDQYRGDQGSKPYQGYIDYVNAQGALAFWVHPEACNQCRVGNVRIDTEAYPLELYRTSGYTGFSILYDGEKKIGAHAGMWDRLLEAYCQGKRRQPAWAIGTLGFDNTGDLGAALEDLRTVVLAERFSRASTRSGRAAPMLFRGKIPATLSWMLSACMIRQAQQSGQWGRRLLRNQLRSSGSGGIF